MENNIQKIRKENNLTQQQLAKKLNTAQSNLCGWEKGKWQPDMESIKKMCEILNCSSDYLIGITSYEKNTNQSKENIFSQEQKNLIEKIKKLNDTQCIRLNAYADRLLEEMEENKRQMFN